MTMGMQKKGYLEEKLYVGNSDLNWALQGVCQSSWLQATESSSSCLKQKKRKVWEGDQELPEVLGGWHDQIWKIVRIKGAAEMKTVTPSRDHSGGWAPLALTLLRRSLVTLSRSKAPDSMLTGQRNLMVSCWASCSGGRQGSSTVGWSRSRSFLFIKPSTWRIPGEISIMIASEAGTRQQAQTKVLCGR